MAWGLESYGELQNLPLPTQTYTAQNMVDYVHVDVSR